MLADIGMKREKNTFLVVCNCTGKQSNGDKL